MLTAALIFPHQLFKTHPVLEKKPDVVMLIESSLFFYDNAVAVGLHRQKLSLHIASMHAYEEILSKRGLNVQLVAWKNGVCELESVFSQLRKKNIETVYTTDPCDFLLNKRLERAAGKSNLTLEILPSPGFINTSTENSQWRASRKRWHMADFYKWQRKRQNILIDNNEPEGGQWSFDKENRKKIPLKSICKIPMLPQVETPKALTETNNRIDKDFKHCVGQSNEFYYPSTHNAADKWLEHFFEYRFAAFGTFEDAIVKDQNWLYHSVLTPLLNIGLLEPAQVVEKALLAASEFNVPINSTEGFIRQIIGWREFIRATYTDSGVAMRTTNHWQHHHSMPSSMYNGTTGIEPVDNTIQRVLQTGYCHHIERLMVIGGFLFLCEIDPDDIYHWFMSMFVDSYDWVMVPNVYAMSQHADGGTITTKPYFSGSNYILKMSNYKKGPWSDIWDALYWRWIILNKEELSKNHRWSMMCKNVERMDTAKRKQYLQTADQFLSGFL